MGTSTFSGPVVSTASFVMQSDTAANIGDITNAMNTTNKIVGRMVIDTTNNKVYWASGTAAADPWYAADKGVTLGGADITPS
jgi:hypothetical protein